MIQTKPEISVLIPVYNAESTVRQAVWSVLNQSFENFELILYLDGCSDGTEEILSGFVDERIQIISETENKGIVHSRNRLVSMARGRYIAWLDSDDLMLPERLARQFQYLEVHPEIFMVGSWVAVRNDRKIHAVKWPSNPEIIKAWMFFRNPLVQSSLMLRNEPGLLTYDSAFEYVEDYRFYSQIFTEKKIALIPLNLCSYYQEHGEGLIHKYRKYDFVTKLEKIMKANFKILDLEPGSNLLSLMRDFLRSNHDLKEADGRLVFGFLKQVLIQNRALKVFESNAMKSVVSFQMLRLWRKCSTMRWRIVAYFLLQPFAVFAALKARVRYL